MTNFEKNLVKMLAAIEQGEAIKKSDLVDVLDNLEIKGVKKLNKAQLVEKVREVAEEIRIRISSAKESWESGNNHYQVHASGRVGCFDYHCDDCTGENCFDCIHNLCKKCSISCKYRFDFNVVTTAETKETVDVDSVDDEENQMEEEINEYLASAVTESEYMETNEPAPGNGCGEIECINCSDACCIYNPNFAHSHEEPAEEDVTKEVKETTDRYSADTWWRKDVVSAIQKKCVQVAANNKFKKDFISTHMVKSTILEVLTGKPIKISSYDEIADRWYVIEYFSPAKTPEMWKLMEEMFERFSEKYLVKSGDKGFVICSEIMTIYYGRVRYMRIGKNGKKKWYELNKKTGKLHLEGTNQYWDLSPENYAVIDNNCKFVRFFAA